MSHSLVPHLRLPLRVEVHTASLSTVEQDTLDEVAQCVEVVLATEPGTRLDLPQFGTPSYLFAQHPLDLAHAVNSIATWEPRGSTTLTTEAIDQLTLRLQAVVQVREH